MIEIGLSLGVVNFYLNVYVLPFVADVSWINR
jgi:hypothetical protein